jgi:type VI secretion system protein ImpB
METMTKDGSVAPKERINIVYRPASAHGVSTEELPLKLLMVGDYLGREDERPLEERAPVPVDKDNFDAVMRSQQLCVDVAVPDRLTGGGQGQLALTLRFEKMEDFSPEAVTHQVPEMRRLLELRNALAALKGPLANVPAFRKRVGELLADEQARTRLMRELGLDDQDGAGDTRGAAADDPTTHGD